MTSCFNFLSSALNSFQSMDSFASLISLIASSVTSTNHENTSVSFPFSSLELIPILSQLQLAISTIVSRSVSQSIFIFFVHYSICTLFLSESMYNNGLPLQYLAPNTDSHFDSDSISSTTEKIINSFVTSVLNTKEICKQ